MSSSNNLHSRGRSVILTCLVVDEFQHQSPSDPSESLIRFQICWGLVPGSPRNLLILSMSFLVDISSMRCPLMQGTMILQYSHHSSERGRKLIIAPLVEE